MSEVKEVKVDNLKKVLQKYSNDMEKYYREHESHRLGKVLTVIDGSIADETQRKAVKDLIHDAWYSNRLHMEYPQAYKAAEALGFKLWEEVALMPRDENEFNPYKELVKE